MHIFAVILLALGLIMGALDSQAPVNKESLSPPIELLAAERKIVDEIASIRKSKGLKPLTFAPPSVVYVQLTCTTAITGKETHDPRFGGFETYRTSDLEMPSENLKLFAQGLTKYTDGRIKKIYTEQSEPRFSVVVFADSTGTPEHQIFTVGLARRGSTFTEFVAPITYDHPIHDSKDWMEQVTPICSSIKPN